MTIVELAAKRVTELDSKFKRVPDDCTIILLDVSEHYVGERVRSVMASHPSGSYRLAGVAYADLGDHDDLGLAYSDADYAEYDREVERLAGKVCWVIPADHPEYDAESAAIVFTPDRGVF